MSNVILGMTMSLDGYINDQEGSLSRLYPDMEAFIDSDALQETIRTTGTVVMGRHAYDMGQGDFTGYEFQTPIFVLTHHVPAMAAKGENDQLKFTFVTDGIESAVQQAKAAAGDKNVVVVGGASTFQQCLKAGLVDKLEIDIMPIILGEGLPLFDHIASAALVELQTTSVTHASPVGPISLRFDVVK